MLVDPDASGNKMMVITGGLELYGVEPETTWTRLVRTALVGTQIIYVENATGWSVGDKLVVAPSYAGRKEFEEVEITAIDVAAGKITFTPAL